MGHDVITSNQSFDVNGYQPYNIMQFYKQWSTFRSLFAFLYIWMNMRICILGKCIFFSQTRCSGGSTYQGEAFLPLLLCLSVSLALYNLLLVYFVHQNPIEKD
jgi:hypothetical protein